MSSTRRTGNPWLTRGVPIAITVVLVAFAVGLASRFMLRTESVPVRRPELAPSNVKIVQLSRDASNHPNAQRVRSALQNHFDSINDKNYERWQTTVVERRKEELPEEQWYQDYRTTSDVGIRVYRIESAPNNSLRVLLSFRSTQSREASPDGQSPCLRWWVVYRFVLESGQLLLDGTEFPRSAMHERC